MYLVSIYFEEKTNKQIQRYINKVAEKTGNTFMVDGNVPPHITVSAFETTNVDVAIQALEKVVKQIESDEITWASAGQFFPYVMYISPVLNQYLHDMVQKIFDGLKDIDGIVISPQYQPFQWIPHTTIGKKLSKEEMKTAFQVMQDSFGVFDGKVVRIGLAKPNPHRDIASWELK